MQERLAELNEKIKKVRLDGVGILSLMEGIITQIRNIDPTDDTQLAKLSMDLDNIITRLRANKEYALTIKSELDQLQKELKELGE
jgi:hypothetical protein